MIVGTLCDSCTLSLHVVNPFRSTGAGQKLAVKSANKPVAPAKVVAEIVQCGRGEESSGSLTRVQFTVNPMINCITTIQYSVLFLEASCLRMWYSSWRENRAIFYLQNFILISVC